MNEKYGIPNIEVISRRCYYVGLGIGFVGVIYLFVVCVLQVTVLKDLPACVFYSMTGFYCPGCGGTRSVYALLHGNIIKSLYYHPFVVYAAAYYILYEGSHTLNLITRGKIKAMYFCPPYFYVGAAIVVVQWLAKNILKYYCGFSL